MRSTLRLLIFTCALILLAFNPRLVGETTPTVTTLYSFRGGTDGASPLAGLVQGSDGNFYGTTRDGGSSGEGVVYRATPSGVYTTLYSFTGSGTDGGFPRSVLVEGSDGNFYGTTYYGGSSGLGTVFRITAAGVCTILHSFTGIGTEGSVPEAGLVQGSDDNFYGTTTQGGTGYGTVFRITAAGVLTTMHSFTGSGDPLAGLVQGSDGNFYGTTNGYDSSSDIGTVFQITPAGVYTTMHSFTGIGTDGDRPFAGLVQGSDGNFYGTTYYGGSSNGGTVYRITPAGVLTTLHNFTGAGMDGANPYAGLVQGSDGNFYGTTEYGGGSGDGAAFQITSAGVYTTLHSFTGIGMEGFDLGAGLVQGSDGNFYGVTGNGGSSHDGTVFRLSPVPSGGTLQFAAASYNTAENAGSVTLAVQRTSGSTGAVSVNYSETDGTAFAGVDYQTTSGTLTWADGDAANKTITIPINDRNLYSGATVNFSVGLTNATGGASLGTIAASTVSILDNDAALPPTITAISPNPVTGSNSSQTITFTGSGFATGMTGVVSWSTGSAALSDSSKIVVDSATQVRIFITTQTDADTWTVKFTNLDGQSSNVFTFQVVAPTPTPTPSITSPTIASGSVGQTFNYQITSNISSATFATSALPAGLSLNSSTGLITGSPTVGGGVLVSLYATGVDGTTAKGLLALTIAQLHSLPTPTSAPPVSAFPASPLDGSLETFVSQFGSLFSLDTLADFENSIPLLHPLIYPGRNSSLKDVAQGAADVLSDVTAGASIALVSEDKLVSEAIKDALLSFVTLIAPQNEVTFLDGTDLVSTLVQYAVDGGDATAALTSVDVYIISDFLIPQLSRYAQDPPDSNYQSVIVPDTLPAPPQLPSTGNPTLDAMFTKSMTDASQSFVLMKAVNDSYDRYSGALVAGDANNAALQLEAMCYYLQSYDQAAQNTSKGLLAIVTALPAAGITDSIYDPNVIRTLQTQVAAEGLPADVVQTLTQTGLSSVQIDAVRTKFLQFDASSISGTMYGKLSAVAATISTLTSAPVTVVSISATTPLADWNGTNGVFTIQRYGDTSADLVVQYTVKGSGIGGVDYQLLKGFKKIKAGKNTAQIKVIPLVSRAAGSKATVKIALAPDAAYVVSNPSTAKIKIIAHD